MREALSTALDGLHRGELPIGAVVAHKGKILARSYTSEKSEGRYLVHADLLALLQADLKRPNMSERREMTLYVTLEPCIMCFGAAMSFFIGEIVFGLESPGDGAISHGLHRQKAPKDFPAYKSPTVTGGVLRSESQELFRLYAEQATPGGFRDWALSLANLNS